MTPKIMHRPRWKAAQVRELDDARAAHEVALTTEAESAALAFNQPLAPRVQPRGGERRQRGRMPPAPKLEKAGRDSPPESFDALAARLNARFDRLATSIEPMRERLRAAEEQSEQLRQKLLANRALRG